MRVTRFGLALAGALTLIGCKRDAGPFLMPTVPLAYTRFVNAVPDTFNTDWRFVDQLEGSPIGILVAFRGFTPYQATAPGSRHLKVFTNEGGLTPRLSVVTTALLDETITLEANKYYTLAHVGFTRDGQTPADKLQVFEDAIPANPGTQVAVRTVNLASGLGAVDVFGYTTGGTVPATATFPNIDFLRPSSYQTFAPGALSFRATNAGTTTLVADAAAPAGAAGDPANNLTTIGGAAQAGSAFTAFVFPRSVALSKAANFTSPGIVYIIDRHPQ